MKKLILVTGGTRGIGASICKMLSANSYQVIANYSSNEQAAEQFLKETDIPAIKWNVADFSECKKNVDLITKKYGKITGLVNNAGIIHDCMLHKMSEDLWHKVLDVNLTSCFNMCRCIINDMRENNFGRIVNISSINGLAGQLGQTNYAATKAGIIGFSKALALESASKGITVNVVAPGYIKTEMTDKVATNIIENLIQQIPVKKLGTPEDIARAVLFLITDASGFITGSTISVNGGQYMH